MTAALQPFASLPPEITDYILGYLDTPSFIEQRLCDDPAETMNNSSQPVAVRGLNLKNASVVCKSWRSIVEPRLFRHVQLTLLALHDDKPLQSEALAEFMSFLDRKAELLSRRASSLTVVIPTDMDSGASTPLASISNRSGSATAGAHRNWLWRDIFSHIDPLRVTLIGSPAALARLVDRHVDMENSWAFAMPYHILSLSRLATGGSRTPSTTSPDLLSIFEWSHMLVNEGSFLKIYEAYEYFNYRPPSLLYSLVLHNNIIDGNNDANGGDGDDGACWPKHLLESFSYVAIFPPSEHASVILLMCQWVERLYVQLVPRDLGMLDDCVQSRVYASDLWNERNTAYAYLFNTIFYPAAESNKTSKVRVFQTGDAADDVAWELGVNYVKGIGEDSGWRVEDRGRFVYESDEAKS